MSILVRKLFERNILEERNTGNQGDPLFRAIRYVLLRGPISIHDEYSPTWPPVRVVVDVETTCLPGFSGMQTLCSSSIELVLLLG